PRMPGPLGHAAFGGDIPGFASDDIAARDRTAEQYFGVQRIGRGVAGFAAGAQADPVAKRDFSAIAAHRRANRAAVLLRARHPVGKAVVRRDVIDLRRWLVVPRTPRRASVDADDRSLIAPENHPVRIVRIDPKLVIIVAAGRALDRRPALARVCRTIEAGVRTVDDVRILRVNDNLAEVPAASPEAIVAGDQAPCRSGVV